MDNILNWSRTNRITNVNPKWKKLSMSLAWPQLMSIGLFIMCVCPSKDLFAQDGVQRPNEMEFDARVIQGQRAEGAVYLFQRATRSLPLLLKYKRDYLSAIVSPVFSQDTELGQKLNTRVNKGHLKIGKQTKVNADAAARKTDKTASNRLKKTAKQSRKSRRKSWRKSKYRSKTKRRGQK